MLTQDYSHLEQSITALRAGAQRWARASVDDRLQLLQAVRARILGAAQHWVDAACAAKGLAPGRPERGEEWITGPYALLYALRGYCRALRSLRRAGRIEFPRSRIHKRKAGVAIRVFPNSIFDRLLLSGISIDVWAKDASTAQSYLEDNALPRVCLVLGAGNIAAIAPLDALHKLVAEGQTVLLKLNPVNDYLEPMLKEIFAPFIERDYLRIVRGDAGTGAFLTAHADIDEIHMTGSGSTHDAIVFGSLDKSVRKVGKRITSELGNVSPVIVVPGAWTSADLTFQAENIVTQKMHNAGFNCIAAQVLVLPQSWTLRNALLDKIREIWAQIAARTPYYPGAAQRRVAFGEQPFLEVDADSGSQFFQTEAFCSGLVVTTLPDTGAQEFLENATAFCNEKLFGTLGASIIIDPKTRAQLGDRFDRALDELRYGCIGINVWSAVGFLLSEASWGAYPGNEIEDVGSGIGIVHNTWLLDHPEKSVAYGPFRPFPRNLLHGEFSLLPRPPWFVTNKNAERIARLLTQFEARPKVWKLPAIFAQALLG